MHPKEDNSISERLWDEKTAAQRRISLAFALKLL